MYLKHFSLAEAPFSIAPNPRYLYLSQRHQEALAHLLYGVNGEGGFVLLTGEIGAGKTTVCRCLLEQIPASCDVAYIFNPRLSVVELLSTICIEFGISDLSENASVKTFVDAINTYLLDAHARGRSSVLIIDEAQNLPADILEQMRLLTNLETNERKLLQIILIGQPELTLMLERPELKQLAQRIVARFHLGPLSKPEVAAYVQHRLAIAGVPRPLIPAALIGLLHRLSGGVPRLINILSDRALLGAYTQGKERVDRATLMQAAREVLHQPMPARRHQWQALAAGVMLTACIALTLVGYRQHQAGTILALAQDTKNNQPTTTPSTVTATANAATATPTSLNWPTDEPLARSKQLAFAAVFQAWGASYTDGDACQQAKDIGLSCQEGLGNLDELRKLNRPAILQMSDDRGREFNVALTALDATGATYVAGRHTGRMSYGDLAAHWSGRYTSLLRLPRGSRQRIRPGEHGATVKWLMQQLAQLPGHESIRKINDGDDPLYDEALTRQVKQFQLEHGLTPDGRAGVQTLLRLSSLTDQSAPRLLRTREEGR